MAAAIMGLADNPARLGVALAQLGLGSRAQSRTFDIGGIGMGDGIIVKTNDPVAIFIGGNATGNRTGSGRGCGEQDKGGQADFDDGFHGNRSK
jgi:hypothetical protein